MALLINLFSACCQGDSRHCSEKVSEIINKRLGTGWTDALPPPFKQTSIFFLSGENVGPGKNNEYCKDLSVNWCLGDSSIEILDSTTGYAINKSVFFKLVSYQSLSGYTAIPVFNYFANIYISNQLVIHLTLTNQYRYNINDINYGKKIKYTFFECSICILHFI